MGELLYIFGYLGVTPPEFFDDEIPEPQLAQRLYRLTQHISEEDLIVLINIAECLNAKIASVTL